jgi:hypothetical protein
MQLTIHKWRWIAVAWSVVALAILGGRPAIAQDDLPGYYQFFMKSGDLTVLNEERERDEEIASGDIAPVHVGKLVADFKLPDGFGNTIGLRDYIGKKNVVLTTMRTWW